ncbi:GFA family protein [Rhizobium sp. 0TCS1.26]|uniref:GFA family protein n=1 Tax=Rhizobium sp. 0TCS1.26 TaxID=3142623 RepID=UPI003D2AB91D
MPATERSAAARHFSGGCACGAIRYHTDATPLMMGDCQCRQCQRESGTGHASALIFPRQDVELEGTTSEWTAVGDGGTTKSKAFCPVCGSPVYMTLAEMPGVIVIRAGSLDDPALYQPQLVTWTAAGHAWDRIDRALPSFEGMPPR